MSSDVGAEKHIKALVIDAGPLITQSASYLQQFAENFYTTPGVYSEIKDPTARSQLSLWAQDLIVRHPKPEFIKKVQSFAKLTGDYSVLSLNDIHIIALAYELECEMNHGDWRLRKYPGEKLEYRKREDKGISHDTDDVKDVSVAKPDSNVESEVSGEINNSVSNSNDSQEASSVEKVVETAHSGNTDKKKPRRRGGKKQRAKREAELQNVLDGEDENTSNETAASSVNPDDGFEEVIKKVNNISLDEKNEVLTEHFDEEDDDGEWITAENLTEELLKDKNDQIQEKTTGKKNLVIKVALATGDFACQNVSLQIGLNLMNAMSGKQIKRVRNYMYRCHACFRLTPIPKDGQQKHFCPKCGGNTLLRCAVSIDNVTGKVTPHLKAGFQWYRRGERFSLPSPLSKNQQKIAGNAGHQHNKQNRHKSLQTPLILREDQKEYQQAVKNSNWQRRQNEKMLEQWVGGGSADNYVSPFGTVQSIRPSDVKVGRGRFVNSSKGKRK